MVLQILENTLLEFMNKLLGGKINLANPDPFAKNKYIKRYRKYFCSCSNCCSCKSLMLDDREKRAVGKLS